LLKKKTEGRVRIRGERKKKGMPSFSKNKSVRLIDGNEERMSRPWGEKERMLSLEEK